MKPSRLYIDRTIRDCVCAVCWSPLVLTCVDGEWKVQCSKYRDEHLFAGLWTQASVERRKTESHFEAGEVKAIYAGTQWGDMMGIPRPLTGDALKKKLERNKQLLGRDDSGLD